MSNSRNPDLTPEDIFEHYQSILSAAEAPETPETPDVDLRERDPETGLIDVARIVMVFSEQPPQYREMIRPYVKRCGGGWLGALRRLMDDYAEMKAAPRPEEFQAEIDALREQLDKADAERDAFLKIIAHLHRAEVSKQD